MNISEALAENKSHREKNKMTRTRVVFLFTSASNVYGTRNLCIYIIYTYAVSLGAIEVHKTVFT